ncbi:hypothetical protein [[Mycobacterium] zoologicum]|uniref:hypothetical protein n=1 Tax=[Mycobacterium] zoologicum TaxID=2872311 RepID=UPI002CD69699|nr:hypothetical protein [Mycolicibacter sp. MYC101]MEB3065741.1 hypothetical protein [Mycolicibacter sp. MYC101]
MAVSKLSGDPQIFKGSVHARLGCDTFIAQIPASGGNSQPVAGGALLAGKYV